MERKNNLLVGCIVFIIVAIVAFGIGFRMIGGKFSNLQSIKSNTWLLINPSGMISDYNEIQYASFMGYNQTSVTEIVSAIQKARDDSKITGILFRPQYAVISSAGRSEINKAIGEFKQSGKPVLAYGTVFTQGDYLLSTAADKILIEPSASSGIMLEGVGTSITFYKDALDKLGIKMHVLQSGEFKGSGEIYNRTSLSQATYDNINGVLKQRYDLLTSEIAQNRKIDAKRVVDILENRQDYIIDARQAQQYTLVDTLQSLDDIYQRYDIDLRAMVTVSKYIADLPVTSSDLVAVIHLNGDISPGAAGSNFSNISANKIQVVMDQIKADKRIRAVVLRINSGGGSALESEMIYQKLKKLKSEIPLVVSMGGVAASGAYYISCASDYIVADPYTITGSIGVLMVLPEAEGLARKIGLGSQNIGYGKYHASMNLLQKTNPELLASLQRNSTSVYEEFKARVAEGRKMDIAEVEKNAQGMIFSASQALSRKLIDEIGGLDTAILKAAEMAGITDYKVTNYPRKLSWVQAIMQRDQFNIFLKHLISQNDLSIDNAVEVLKRRLKTNQWLFLMPCDIE